MDEIRSDELYHYGRKGMKWYQNIFTAHKQHKTAKKRKKALEKAREAKKQKAIENESLEEKKARILKSRSAKELYDNADLFDTKELNDAYNRLTLERNIKNLVPEEVSKGQKFVDNVNRYGTNISNIIDTGGKMYNSAAKIRNTFFKGDGKPWPTFGQNDKAVDKNAKARKKLEDEAAVLKAQLDIAKRKKELADLKSGKADNKPKNNDSKSDKSVKELEERIEELEKKLQEKDED